MTRKYKFCIIPNNVFLSCLVMNQVSSGDCIAKISLDLPPETTIVGSEWDCLHNCQRVYLHNEEWPELAPGETAPYVPIEYTYCEVKFPAEKLAQPFVGKPNVTELPAPDEPKSWRNEKPLL